MNYYNYYIYLIILVKIIFTLLLGVHFYYLAKGEKDSENHKITVFWKKRIEFIFEILMALLLIFVFDPYKNRTILINHETIILLYILGYLLLFMADWSSFISESWFLKMI